jgi:hypothetical protein
MSQLSSNQSAGGERGFALACGAIYFILCLAATLHHAMWRDELQAWLIARDSTSLLNLLHNVRYEGHGMLYYLLLYPLAHITHNPTLIQWLNVAIASTSAYVVLRYAPFGRLPRLLLVLGYFAFFEYAVISRNYSLGMLLTFCLCAEWCGRRRLLVLAVIMAAMANNNVYSLITAMAFGLGMLVAIRTEPAFGKQLSDHNPLTGVSALLVGFAMLVAAFLLRPPADGGFGQPWRIWPESGGLISALHTGSRAISEIYNAYLPLPQWREDFWNSAAIWPLARPFIAVALLVWVIIALRRRPVAFTFFVVGTAGLVLFAYFKYLGYLRHQGALWILLVAAFWIAKERRDAGPDNKGFIFLAAAQAVIGCGVWIAAWFIPFSPERQVAALLKDHHLDQLPIVGHWDHTVSPLSGWLDRDIVLADSHRSGSFIKWNKSRDPVSDADALAMAQKLADQKHSEVILILTPPPNISVYWPQVPGIKELAAFNQGMVDDEKYWIYAVWPHH